jgi:hypothetical protein
MVDFKTKYKNLYNQYNKKLLADHKANFSVLNNNMNYFITYLKLLRDYYLLTDAQAESEDEVSLKAATLVAAVGEYEKYESCICKYYKSTGERLVEGTAEEISKKYNDERNFH